MIENEFTVADFERGGFPIHRIMNIWRQAMLEEIERASLTPDAIWHNILYPKNIRYTAKYLQALDDLKHARFFFDL